MPFDQYQRYRLVADIVAGMRGEQEALSILDVGGRTALLRKFLPDDQVHLVDVDPSEEEGLVLGDGSCLPFGDDCVDAVVTFDTLEHVPPPRRAAFLAECRRVARRWVIVAGPYSTEGVEHAESLLESFLHEKMGVEHRYLAEHKENGLPSLAETEAALSGDGASVASVGHASLSRWLGLMCLELYMDRDPQLRALADDYYEFYNGVLYSSDHSAPVYRHAVVATYDETSIPRADQLLAPPVAPAGTFEPFRDLIQKLVGFDMERDVVSKEWARLEQVNADLHLDLEGHKSTLGILQDNNEQQVEVIEELRQRAIDLVGNEDLLQERIEDLTGEVSAHEDRAGHLETRIGALEADMEQTRKELVEVQGLAAQKQEEVLERDRQIDGLESHRQELEQSLDQVNITLGEKQGSLDLVRGELTGQRLINEALQARLRDRWENLLRAFGLK